MSRKLFPRWEIWTKVLKVKAYFWSDDIVLVWWHWYSGSHYKALSTWLCRLFIVSSFNSFSIGRFFQSSLFCFWQEIEIALFTRLTRHWLIIIIAIIDRAGPTADQFTTCVLQIFCQLLFSNFYFLKLFLNFLVFSRF